MGNVLVVRVTHPTPREGQVLVVRVSSVDRGACIRDFSQYMDEVEYLWVPGSYLQQVAFLLST